VRNLRLSVFVAASAITVASTVVPLPARQSPPSECQEWQQCRQLALDARDLGQYERFHDLAWRTIQIGPRNDPALMYLLARAQSLSGRRRDALIMLRRLAEMGVVTEAATDEDLRRTRELAGWSEIETLVARITANGAAPVERPVSAPVERPAAAAEPSVPADLPAAPPPVAAAPAVVRSAPAIERRDVEAVASFSAAPFVPGGLAYDAVSRRFVFGDLLGRKLVVVGEGSERTIDLVRSETAGFHDVTALEIDAKRGDLWVASTARDGEAGAIHKLQLISGRPVGLFELPKVDAAIKLADVAVAPNGAVLVLDSSERRVLALRPGAKAVDVVMPLKVARPTSITAAGDERTAYLAHAEGIVRLDLQQKSAAPVAPSKGVSLENFERIRWHRGALVGVQVLPDGSRAIARLQLSSGGRTVNRVTLFDASIGRDAGPTFATVSGDDIYYVTVQQRDPSSTAGATNVVVQRMRLP
jgi:hypothetical protein